jgi:hypothetical protein
MALFPIDARTKCVGLALAVAITGCASPRVDPSRSITVEDHWYGHTYQQSGDRIGRCRLGLALYQVPESRSQARSAGTYAMNGVLFLGGSIGAGLAASQTSQGTSAALIGVSAASLLVSAFLFSRADARVADAVAVHNAQLTRPRISGPVGPFALEPSPGCENESPER